MNYNQYNQCVKLAVEYDSQKSYIKALKKLLDDMPDANECELVYIAANRPVKDVATMAHLPVRQIAIRLAIPQRTIENWSSGTSRPPVHEWLMIQQLLGIYQPPIS